MRKFQVGQEQTLGGMLHDLRWKLGDVSDSPALDAQVLLAHLLEKPRSWVIAHPEQTLTLAQQRTIESWAARLQSGEPLPYLLGRWEFFGLEFLVDPAVLIPRPETELLVEKALEWLQDHPSRRLAADVGTGSGCIAISLSVHSPNLRLLATDLSRPALSVAAANASLHDVAERVWLTQADLLTPAARPFDLICANLPYIPSGMLDGLKVSTREPLGALNGGNQGLDQIGRLLNQSPALLAPEGLLLLEIEASQGDAVLDLARQFFPAAQVRVLSDLAGRDRLLTIQS